MSDKELGENELMGPFRQGEQWAFTRVFEEMFDKIYAYCRNFVEDSAQAKDIASETFQKLFERHAGFEKYDAIRSFLFVTAKNACLDHLKIAKRLDAKQKIFLSLLAMKGIMEDADVPMEMYKKLYKALDQLSPGTLDVLERLFWQDKKYKEIGEELGISEDAVGNRRYFGIKRLRAIMGKNGIWLILALGMQTNTARLSTKNRMLSFKCSKTTNQIWYG